MTLSPLVYQITFLFYRVGFGASIGVFMVVIALPFAVLYVWRVRREGLF